MLKKIVSLVVGATLVLATLGVAAATVGTTSTYDMAAGTIAVETSVTNANAGEVYTYLAYKLGENGSLENLQNNEVVYVDEKVIAEGETSTTFTYTTAIANDQAIVLVGDPATDNTFNGVIEESEVYLDYTVVVDNGEAVAKKLNVTDASDDSLVTIAAELANVVISGVTLNGEDFDDYVATDNGLLISYSAIKELDTVAFAINTTSGAVASAVYMWRGAYNADEDYIIALAKVEGDSDAFGINFSDGAENEFTAAAKAKGTDGMFAIRLNKISESIFAGAEKVYASAYAGEMNSDATVGIVLSTEAVEEN